jgi:hypothetical protein
MTTQHEEGDLRVWWIPQIPMSAFHVDVETVEQGRWLCNVLADYDTFQFENNVKPDYSNAGGVQQYEIIDGLGDWYDVDDEDEDD